MIGAKARKKLKSALAALLRAYKLQVQVMQANAPARRWLSKTFTLMQYWPVLFDVFPDASVIRIHRDPARSLASACALMQSLTRSANPAAFGAIASEIYADNLARMRDAPAPARAKLIDISYEDLCAAPADVCAFIAGEIGLPDPESLRARALDYLASPRALKRATHTYTLEEFGLDEAEVRERFRDDVMGAG